MPIILVNPASEEPITLAEAKVQCQVDMDLVDEDVFIESLILSAVDFCEQYTGRTLITQEQQYLGRFTLNVELAPNLLSVEAIKYMDSKGVVQQLASDQFYITTAVVGEVTARTSWPATYPNHPQPVEINFTCGYGTAEDVPDSIKQCIRLLVGHWFRNREMAGAVSGRILDAASSLLTPFRVVNI
jgi:uncharacterized phiE125 gp8 family phage protein